MTDDAKDKILIVFREWNKPETQLSLYISPGYSRSIQWQHVYARFNQISSEVLCRDLPIGNKLTNSWKGLYLSGIAQFIFGFNWLSSSTYEEDIWNITHPESFRTKATICHHQFDTEDTRSVSCKKLLVSFPSGLLEKKIAQCNMKVWRTKESDNSSNDLWSGEINRTCANNINCHFCGSVNSLT